MKKIWILERFENVEQIEASIEKSLADIETAKKTAEEKSIEDKDLDWFCDFENKYIEKCKKDIENGGRWLGWEGKCNYKTFCQTAIESLRRDRKDKKLQHEFRVLECELIDENSKGWIGNYKVVKENAGVMRYFYTQI